jgi:glycosyltransferase involved in cell wall biosynthesis
VISNLARATADLHCHSSASGPNGNWWYAQFGLADCKTPPDEVYAQAKAAGMTFVTLTDHDLIDGALELAHNPDFIVGEEVTVVFADDGMRIDVVVLGLDERQHTEIQARRDDAHVLVRYLRAERLVHFLAHPIYDPGNALEPSHLDRLAALFPLWETRNGARLPEANELAARLLPNVATHRRLAAEYGFEPSPLPTGGVGGSDDHGGIDIGTTYTLTPPVANVEEFLEHLRAGRCRPAGLHAHPARMTHMVARLLDRHHTGPVDEQRLEIWSALADGKLEHRDVARLAEALAFGGGEDEEELALPFSDPHGVGRQLQTLRRYGRSQARLIPYLTVQAYLAREREGVRRLASRTGRASARGGIRVALLADGLGSVNGVAETYRELLPHLPEDVRVTAIGCGKARGIDVLEVSRAGTLAFPLYPDLDLPLPHLSEVGERVFDSDADVIHVSGPGPLGLAGLAAAKLLRLPLVATYHTELGDYARALTDDPLLVELAHAATSRFYAAADLVVAPSRATAHRLRTLLGIPEDRIALVPQGVDCLRFAPEHRQTGLLSSPDEVTVLCVARLSKEKAIEHLVDAHALLGRDDVRLVIVGDGPARQALEERAAGRATFTGWLEGEALSQTFASADLFVLPSTTETCGQVVLEAQASGLPCVVSSQGAVREAVIPGTSGIIVERDTAAAHAAALEALVEDADRRSSMSRKARENALTRNWVAAADGLTQVYRRLVQSPDEAVTELLAAG